METQRKLKSPNIRVLESLVDRIESEIAKGNPIDTAMIEACSDSDYQLLLDTARWVCFSLNNRNVYHKRQQLKKKEFERIAKQHLHADEIAAIERKVAAMTEAELLGNDLAVVKEGEEGEND